MIETITRPALRYHGGKWMLAPWVIEHFPPHRVYTESYGGAASVLLRKPRSYSEVYNDLDLEVVNLFRVLRDPVKAQELEVALRLTPFSRVEFNEAYQPQEIEVARAWAMVVRSFMGFGSAAHNPRHRTGFRANSNRSGTTPAHDWANYPDGLSAITERLRGVVIECRPALDILRQHDGPQTLHYVDPPYTKSTRYLGDATNCYTTEMDDDDHRALGTVLRDLEGMVVLSGYACDLYDLEIYPDWKRVERVHHADGARKRVEVLWLNAAAVSNLRSLFQ